MPINKQSTLLCIFLQLVTIQSLSSAISDYSLQGWSSQPTEKTCLNYTYFEFGSAISGIKYSLDENYDTIDLSIDFYFTNPFDLFDNITVYFDKYTLVLDFTYYAMGKMICPYVYKYTFSKTLYNFKKDSLTIVMVPAIQSSMKVAIGSIIAVGDQSWLTKARLIGIIVGSIIGAIFLALGIFLILRKIRKNRLHRLKISSHKLKSETGKLNNLSVIDDKTEGVIPNFGVDLKSDEEVLKNAKKDIEKNNE